MDIFLLVRILAMPCICVVLQVTKGITCILHIKYMLHTLTHITCVLTAYSLEVQRVKGRCREEHLTQHWGRSQGLEWRGWGGRGGRRATSSQ